MQNSAYIAFQIDEPHRYNLHFVVRNVVLKIGDRRQETGDRRQETIIVVNRSK
ncbi:MAG: hypothetical protein F6K08_30690 [Okeania sp. SIO1H6]|nr:hypothetical protein [Okeania sp. SIO1H6]